MAKSEKQIVEYIEEHILYELLMLRYSYSQIKSVPSQLDWNAFFVSFTVYGRNLYDFLLNHRDRNTFAAVDFTDNYRPPKAGTMSAIISRLNEQVAHLGQRTKDRARKVGLDAATQLFEWIELHMPTFEAAIRPEYQPYWNRDLADPTKVAGDAPSAGPTGPTPTRTSIPWTSVNLP